MKIPSKIKIGGIMYDVKFVNDDEIDARFAEIDYPTDTISIKKILSQNQKEAAFFHEMLHAINSKMNESTIEFMAQMIYQVMKDNHLLKN